MLPDSQKENIWEAVRSVPLPGSGAERFLCTYSATLACSLHHPLSFIHVLSLSSGKALGVECFQQGNLNLLKRTGLGDAVRVVVFAVFLIGLHTS